jgi:predicted RNase H-like HicB family nuclease
VSAEQQQQAEGYHIVYEEGPTGWSAYVEDLPGCFATGRTREQVERRISEAIPLHLDALERQRRAAWHRGMLP